MTYISTYSSTDPPSILVSTFNSADVASLIICPVSGIVHVAIQPSPKHEQNTTILLSTGGMLGGDGNDGGSGLGGGNVGGSNGGEGLGGGGLGGGGLGGDDGGIDGGGG